MRILMLTSVYKDESLGNKDTSTNIVNSFVKEWKKQGHEVLVIHNSHCYPRVIHEIPEKIKKSLAARMGFAISDFNAVKEKEYHCLLYTSEMCIRDRYNRNNQEKPRFYKGFAGLVEFCYDNFSLCCVD